jgi:hypothetical protein
MSGNVSVSSPPAATNRPLPGFLGALRGIWLMTWRSQIIPRRLPLQLGTLMILPVLIYITIVSPEAWLRKRLHLGNADNMLRGFSHRLERKKIDIQPAAQESVRAILTEEIERGRDTWKENAGESPEARQKRLKEHITDCYDRISTRAKTVLDDKQYEQLDSGLQPSRDNALARASEVLVPWNRTEPFYHWLIDFYFFIILPLTCVRGCAPLIRDELQADTLGFLITRPIGRARLLVAKYLAQVASLEIILLLETLLLFAAGAAKQVPSLGALLAMVIGVQILVIPAWSALGLLFGQLTGRYMAAALVYGAIVELGIGRIPTNINTLSIVRHLQTLLNYNSELNHIYSWPSDSTALAIAAIVVGTVTFLGIAALLFSLIEYHHAAEMQK